jgi:hypothetical protein
MALVKVVSARIVEGLEFLAILAVIVVPTGGMLPPFDAKQPNPCKVIG